MTTPSLLDDLEWRGLIAHSTDRDALRRRWTAGEACGSTWGFDPTAPSLHMGHLVQVLTARRLQQAGHTPYALVGGATGMIGDPRDSGERTLNTAETVAEWVGRVRAQIEPFLSFEGDNAATMVNNLDWTEGLSTIDFCATSASTSRSTDARARHGQATARGRWHQLHRVQLRPAAVVGLPQPAPPSRRDAAVRRLRPVGNPSRRCGGWSAARTVATVHAFATPLLTKADGTKYGKTEGGALWLDPRMLSPYAFYQFWLNVEDEKLPELLRVFTFLSREEIEALDAETAERPFRRAGQKALAEHVTTLVHGAEETARIQAASAALFGGGELQALDPGTLGAALTEVGATSVPGGPIPPVVDLLVASGLSRSKGEARRTVGEGGAYLNNTGSRTPSWSRPPPTCWAAGGGPAARQEEPGRRRGRLSRVRRGGAGHGAGRTEHPRSRRAPGRAPRRRGVRRAGGRRGRQPRGGDPGVARLAGGAAPVPRHDARRPGRRPPRVPVRASASAPRPTTLQREIHPDGELAVARALAAAGAPMVVSSNAATPFAEIGATGVGWWLQAYVPQDRGLARGLLRRAVAAGARAVVPDRRHPGGEHPSCGPSGSVWDVVDPASVRVNFERGYLEARGSEKATDLGPADVAWLGETTGLPVVVKGVLDADGARAAVDAGAAAVWVVHPRWTSARPGARHRARARGGRASAVGHDAEVYVDGGLRDGVDLLLAWALGARCAFLGRPVSRALADGEEGVASWLRGLTTAAVEAVRLAGCTGVEDCRGLRLERAVGGCGGGSRPFDLTLAADLPNVLSRCPERRGARPIRPGSRERAAGFTPKVRR